MLKSRTGEIPRVVGNRKEREETERPGVLWLVGGETSEGGPVGEVREVGGKQA